MPDMLEPGMPTLAERPVLERRRSRNPLKNLMQHLSVEPPPENDDDRQPRRGSLIRSLSWRKSRSPSAHSDRSGCMPQDPDLCPACTVWAADIDNIFDEMDSNFMKNLNPTAADAFDNKEHSLGHLKELEENRWSTKCPLCKLFHSVHIPSEGDGDLYLSGFSSRDTNYLIDTQTMYDQEHTAKSKAKGYSPAFLAVVPKKSGDGALSWDVNADWFRNAGMLYRTAPEHQNELLSAVSGASGRSGGGSHSRGPSLSNNHDWVKRGVWGREIGQTIDMSVGQDWLRFCEFYHQGRCGRKPVTQELPGFRLLDCSKTPPKLVDASIKERYVALSYVWGRQPATDSALPKVISDAIIATKDMGVRYLWVDRQCMDHLQPADRLRQIARMDEIFEGAIFAIIAACGRDANSGLPGVGQTSRPAQPKYEFVNSDVTLVSSLQDPRLAIQNSAWYTRGWTYQEGLLARRRLIFTEQQMYWECEGMCCPESLVLPLDLYHDSEEQRMCDFMRPGLFNGVSFVGGSWERWKRLPSKAEESSTLSIFREADQHVINYTRRDLSYDEDSLNAFLGISRRLETSIGRGKVFNVLGIPVWAPSVDERMSPPRTRDLFALSTCFWHHQDGVVARRRPHMPSWTWVGWKGAVDLFSSITIVDVDGNRPERKNNLHHYVTATQFTRNDSTSLRWTYSPDFVLLDRDGKIAYDFGATDLRLGRAPKAPALAIKPYAILVPNPFVLDRVKAKTHPGGWIFNNLSVDVRLSRGNSTTGGGGIREYIERHAKGEWMSLLWFVEEGLIMLLVVERSVRDGRISWERVGRMRMSFADESKEVLKKFGRLEKMVEELPLRRLGGDIIIE
ncbi:heterokaryon incompatibility protein-domain-containing protein [Mariannaea sp. PMI_226]|nr:heterokaryon incompatibility protein-domain-containing protein [Mariannaea sp. PMI_226]